MSRLKPKEKTGHIVTDRDARSRTVKATPSAWSMKPDVEVNDRPHIMGDEGPVAKSNPHNCPPQVGGTSPDRRKTA